LISAGKSSPSTNKFFSFFKLYNLPVVSHFYCFDGKNGVEIPALSTHGSGTGAEIEPEKLMLREQLGE